MHYAHAAQMASNMACTHYDVPNRIPASRATMWPDLPDLMCTVASVALPQEVREVRSKIIDLILAMDMRTHFEFLNRFRTIRGSDQYNYKKNEDDRWCAVFSDAEKWRHMYIEATGQLAVEPRMHSVGGSRARLMLQDSPGSLFMHTLAAHCPNIKAMSEYQHMICSSSFFCPGALASFLRDMWYYPDAQACSGAPYPGVGHLARCSELEAAFRMDGTGNDRILPQRG